MVLDGVLQQEDKGNQYSIIINTPRNPSNLTQHKIIFKDNEIFSRSIEPIVNSSSSYMSSFHFFLRAHNPQMDKRTKEIQAVLIT